ncbi:homoserine O-acetyltransferase [candidate division KSB1 bacterium]|nr:homoserine O-acetyltransferase [candidate division KSB1 bacterium]
MDNIRIPHTKRQFTFGPFRFESGALLDKITITYETWGKLNENRDNVVLIEHALTGTSHAASADDSPEKGWWESLIGPGKSIDTNKYFAICPNVIGACSGSSGPSSINEATGNPYGVDFPIVTIKDMVRSQKKLFDHLQINQLLTITGASMGAMQAMEWAAHYPEMVKSIIPISAPGRAYPQSIAYRKAQRKAIMNDPDWNNGNYYGKSIPEKGIELARLIGFITYRSEHEFAERFGREHRDSSLFDLTARFEVESYLEHHGKKLAQWFDANTYLYLSKSMDLHDLSRGYNSYEEGIQQIQAHTLCIGVESDILFPNYQQKEFINILSQTNPNAAYKEIKSLYGHDAFLIEEEQINSIITGFLTLIESKIKETDSDKSYSCSGFAG